VGFPKAQPRKALLRSTRAGSNTQCQEPFVVSEFPFF
jgi:hypothetical protein